MTKQKGGSGYTKLFKQTLSPCYKNVQKLGWHGGSKKSKRKTKTMKGGNKIATCQSLTPSWYNQGQNPASSKSISLGGKINEYQFTRLLPNNQLYTASQLVMEPPCAPMYPNLVPKTGGGKKKKTKKNTSRKLKVTVGKDGKKYYFRGGKRVAKPKK